ncbi:hypothetical protein [Actinomadura sp. NTSP31]|uniref:hypothetical protein n=1 Tax=Actinomadura sp. NTSP31 TaxID=1735447 RepID=UPI0035BF45F6
MEALPRLTACATLVLALAGCSAHHDDAPPVPAGFREHRADAYAFAYPSGWTLRPGTEDGGAPALDVDGPELPSGVDDGQIHLGRRDRYTGTLDGQLAQFRGLALLNGYHLTAVRRTGLDGAGARRVEARYEITSADGTRTPMHLTGLYVLTGRRTLLEFMIRSPDRGTAAARVPAILGSFRLEEGR